MLESKSSTEEALSSRQFPTNAIKRITIMSRPTLVIPIKNDQLFIMQPITWMET